MEEIEEPDEVLEEPSPPRRRPYGFVALALILAGAIALIARDRATTSPPSTSTACSDCGHATGELHEFGCLKERCPFCGGQLATCDCIETVLNLTDAERQALDEPTDDEVEPLKGILAGWRTELDKKGRRPVSSAD